MVISETVTVQEVSWELERPDEPINIAQYVRSSYSGNELSVFHSIFIMDYNPKKGQMGSIPVTAIGINVSTQISEGYIVGVYFEFRSDNFSAVNVEEQTVDGKDTIELDGVHCQLVNLSINDYADQSPPPVLKDDIKFFIDTRSSDNPKQISLWVAVQWIEAALQYQSHQLEGMLRLTYFNGTAYNEVVLPTVIRWIADQAGSSFDTAKEVTFGNYTAYVMVLTDRDDYYKIWLSTGQAVNVSISNPSGSLDPMFDLYLYGPHENIALNSTERKMPKQITFFANEPGFWYIRASAYAGFAYYLISIEGE
jgi:hypothetical protein